VAGLVFRSIRGNFGAGKKIRSEAGGTAAPRWPNLAARKCQKYGQLKALAAVSIFHSRNNI
jgi:hypothetical protein